MEKKLDVFNLTYIRRSAEIEAKKKKDQEPKTWWGSVSNWWGGSKPHDDPGTHRRLEEHCSSKFLLF